MGFYQILEAMAKYHHPMGMIYVGSSGDAKTPLWPLERPKSIQWVSSSLAMDKNIKQQPQKYKDIIPYHELISSASLEVDFYEASLSEFSGCVSPDNLKPYWQNIKTLKSTKRLTKTLDQLRDQNSKTHQTWLNANWMIIDQLAALDILQGASKLLPQLDGIIIKAVLPDQIDIPDTLVTSSAEQITQWLGAHRFKAVAQKEGRHKSFVHILFVRDWKSEHTIVSSAQHQALADITSTSDLALKTSEEFEQKLLKQRTQIAALDQKNIQAQNVHAAELDSKQNLINKLTLEQTRARDKFEALKLETGKKIDALQSIAEETKAQLEQIERLELELKNLTNALKTAQSDSLQKGKLAELHLQDLEFLRKKFKVLKKNDNSKAELLKRVQVKLLAALGDDKVLEDKTTRSPTGKTKKKSV